MKIHHHRLQEHHVTYLKWSKEKVKLPRFNVHRQTADKQCSYLQTESIKLILSRDEFLECDSFPSPRHLSGARPCHRRSSSNTDGFKELLQTGSHFLFLKESPWDRRLSPKHQKWVIRKRFWWARPSWNYCQWNRFWPFRASLLFNCEFMSLLALNSNAKTYI